MVHCGIESFFSFPSLFLEKNLPIQTYIVSCNTVYISNDETTRICIRLSPTISVARSVVEILSIFNAAAFHHGPDCLQKRFSEKETIWYLEIITFVPSI